MTERLVECPECGTLYFVEERWGATPRCPKCRGQGVPCKPISTVEAAALARDIMRRVEAGRAWAAEGEAKAQSTDDDCKALAAEIKRLRAEHCSYVHGFFQAEREAELRRQARAATRAASRHGRRAKRLRAEVKQLRAILDDLDYIRQQEVSEVRIVNPNPEFDGPSEYIAVTAPWTLGEDWVFSGESLAECLCKARKAADAAGGKNA